jgi:leader peptidase (prepilin peptidase)/N-methyltransferase
MDWQQFFPYATGFVLVLGLVLGSFLNVCVYRLPRELSIVHPRSACPQCNAPIRAYDNIPVLSWLLLRGRCRDCKAPISPRYSVIELLTALLFATCFYRYGYSLATLQAWTLCFLLTGLIFTDLNTRLLPDALTFPGLGLGLAFSLLTPTPLFFTDFLPFPAVQKLITNWRAVSFGESALAALAGALLFYGTGYLYFRWKGVEGLGMGDVKLIAMLGAFLGMKLVLFTIATAAFTGSALGLSMMLLVWRKRLQRRLRKQSESRPEASRRAWQSARMLYHRYAMPFGSFLGAAGLLALFYGDAILRWYMRLFLLRE